MIGVIAKLTVKAGKEAEFEKHAKALISQVTANEAGCELYELFKSSAEKNADTSHAGTSHYVFMEKYRDTAALKAHSQTPYFLAAQSTLGPCLAAAPDVKVYNAV